MPLLPPRAKKSRAVFRPVNLKEGTPRRMSLRQLLQDSQSGRTRQPASKLFPFTLEKSWLLGIRRRSEDGSLSAANLAVKPLDELTTPIAPP
jgi:hypothetical protein